MKKYKGLSSNPTSATTTETLLDLDVKEIITKVERKYRIKLPRQVVAIDLGEKGRDLFVRFKPVADPLGEPSKDGRVIFFYDGDGGKKPVGVEILYDSLLGFDIRSTRPVLKKDEKPRAEPTIKVPNLLDQVGIDRGKYDPDKLKKMLDESRKRWR